MEHYIIETINQKNNKKRIIKNNINKKLSIKNKTFKIIKNNDKNNILCLHGNKIPKKELLKEVNTIIIGHEHPAVPIKEGSRVELFKAFLIGKWKKFVGITTLNIYFMNPLSKKEKVWTIFPYVHDKICDSSSLKLGIKIMANMVDLDRIVDFYCTAMEILNLSQKRYSLNIHRIRYEDLVLDFEGEVLNILAFLNLKWGSRVNKLGPIDRRCSLSGVHLGNVR